MAKKLCILTFLILFAFSLNAYSEEINLIDRAANAKWHNTDNKILAFGVDGRANGTAKYEYDVTLENSKTQKKVLFTHPQWKGFGNVVGVFQNISIPQKGGKIIIAGGFLQGAQGTDGVKFSANFISAPQVITRKVRRVGQPQSLGVSLCSFNAKYDGKIDRVECDLSGIAGQKGSIVLVVGAGNSPDNDWAVWTAAKLVFGPAVPKEKKVRMFKTLSGHTGRIYRASFSPNSRYLVTASGDNTAKIWEVSSGRMIKTLRGHSSHVFSASFSPNNRRVVTAGGNTAKIWEVSSGIQIKMLIGHTKVVHSAEFSPDGNYVVTTSEDGAAKIWDARSGKEMRTIAVTSGGWVYSASFSPNGRIIAIGAHGGLAGTWRVSDGKRAQTFRGHNRAVNSVSFSRNGRYLATASVGNTAKIWEVSSGRLIQTLSGNYFGSASFSPNGKYVVTGNDGGIARIWEVTSGKQILRIEHAAMGKVISATFSPNGKYVATAGEDQTAKIWQVTLK